MQQAQKRHRTKAMDDDAVCPGCGASLRRRMLGTSAYRHQSGEYECKNPKCPIIKVYWKNGKKMIAKACDVP